jgi:hypothetical protein
MKFRYADELWRETTEQRSKIHNEYLIKTKQECIDEIDRSKKVGSYSTTIDLNNKEIYKILKAELKEAGYKVSRLKDGYGYGKYFVISWEKRKKEML